MRSTHALTWGGLLSLLIVVPASAQLGTYAVSHPFALPTATTTRLFGMGGFSSCIPDAGFANPAFGGSLTRASVVMRNMVTSFEGDLSLNSQQASFAMPLEDNRQGIQVTAFHVDSNNAAFAGLGVPARLSLEEDDVSVHYGRRLTDRWLVGVSVSPVFHNSLNIVPGAAPQYGMRLRATADWGFRLGTVYELGDRGWIGAVYDRYDEDVRGTGVVSPGDRVGATFQSEEIVAGAAFRLTDQLLAAVEWQQLSHESGAFEDAAAGIRFGIEGLLGDGLAVRLGDNQGAVSAGVGWSDEDWSVNYAFIRDWNDNVFGDTYGGSDTHSFELTHSW